MNDFKNEQKAQTYIIAHRCDFGCDPTNSEVIWRLKSQSRVYTYDSSFLCVGNNLGMNQNARRDARNARDDDPVAWVDQKMLDVIFLFAS